MIRQVIKYNKINVVEILPEKNKQKKTDYSNIIHQILK